MTTTRVTVGAFLTLSLSAAAFAIPQSWENVISTNDAGVPGVKGAVWVPNQFNNPTIDTLGRVSFRGQIGGAGITTANSRLIMQGAPSAWSILARDGSGVPANLIVGYVFNTMTGINGVGSANNISADGGVLVSGNVNGLGVVATTDTAMFFIAADGASSLLVREGDVCPGTAGATMSTAMTAGSGQQTNNTGRTIFNTALLGGDVVGTTNNNAIVTYSPTGAATIFRKGSSAPGFADGTTMTPDAFQFQLTGNHVEFGGTLVNAATVTTSNDKARFTSSGAAAGSLRMYIREGSVMAGLEPLAVKPLSSISPTLRSLRLDGSILNIVDLSGGDTVALINDKALVRESNGTFNMIMRRGESVPGVAAPTVFGTFNTSSVLMNNNGMLAFQGILMHSDGVTVITNGTYVGVRKANGSLFTLIRQGDALPDGSGTIVGSLNGNTSICSNDEGLVVFNATYTGGAAICAWDETTGLRVLTKTGDTSFTGTAANSISLIGGTGMNGNGGCTGLSSNGWLTLRAGDSVNSKYTIARIDLGMAPASCVADLSGDGIVDGADIATLLDSWNAAGGDLDNSGVTDAADLAIMLDAWGACP
ncbi:MAG: hypothetical protein EXS10_01730 [Phycisphaerales bacterium]|nr:hypothetical protein [Phycisphaerales bacterium]